MAKNRKEQAKAKGSKEEAVSPGMGAAAQPSEPGKPGEFARMLLERRDAVGLTQAELARRAGLSLITIQRTEKSSQPPSRKTLRQLMAVPELQLALDPSSELMASVDAERDFGLNCWIAPGFNALALTKEMVRDLNAQGGHMDQTDLYLDPTSATDWCSVAMQESYLPTRAAVPLDRAATEVLSSIGSSGLDVIALGSGDGKDEVRLVQHLIDDKRRRDLRLFLLDISQPLLSAAFEHANERLGDYKGVSVTAVQGNFHHLSCYRLLLHQPARSHRRRLVCMLGYTFGNLLNEPLFIRNSLAGFASGDLLLLNTGLVCAPSDRADEIRKKEPALAGGAAGSFHQANRFHNWITGPLRRYVDGIRELVVDWELDVASCPVPGSYAVVAKARLADSEGQKRVFSLLYTKRYDEPKFVECFRAEGWDRVAGWQYGTAAPALMLSLFRKR